MSAAQHIEWLNLVEKTGPFLAVGVLDEAFPQGLEKVETRRRQRVRSAYDEWRDAVDEGDPQLEGLHREWVRLVLEELLEYEPSVLKPTAELPATLTYLEPLTGAELKPDFAVLSGDKASLLIARYAPDTDLSAPLAGESWAASPIERMTTLCRATGVRIGLITDGEQWTLVSVPADGGSSLGTWYARIWQQEPVTLQAFVSLLDVRRCFGPAEVNLDSLFLRSLEHQDELTDTLGEQVRRAVEVLVQALDRADLDRERELLKDVSPAQLYEAGLTVMMRLVVLLCAEERSLLLLGEPIYDQYYAVSTLRSRLLKDKERLGEEVLERRYDAWSRLLSVFRVVFGGIEHETLRLPPLGGSLFDPDRFPFLEGRATDTSWRDVPAVPLPIDNRTVLMLLTALQVLEQRSGALQLSYEALNVEQIGHVYEGLLERTVKRVPETTLGLIGSQKAVNPNVSLHELETVKAAGTDKLLAFLLEKTGRSESGLRSALAKPVDEDLYHGILLASGSDIQLADRIKPFGPLLRTDSWGDPLAYRKDSFTIALGVGRRETGTHYTPKSLTEPVVQHTLIPLAYVGPAEGKPHEEWRLRTPVELLALKICDMAMGSGAFLVQTCRWLAERLVEAWDAEEKAGRAISIDGAVLDQPGNAELLPRDQAERVLIARRLIASRCLYGVDINPMAVELAKLSLWLITMMRNRPFSFLDHALKSGDSLLGVSSVQQIENFSLRPGERQVTFATAKLFRYVEEASKKRCALEAIPSNDHNQIETKNLLHAEAEAATSIVKAFADALIAFELRSLDGKAYEEQRTGEAENVQMHMKRDTNNAPNNQQPTVHQLSAYAREQLRGRRTFHWPVEFPEVFARGGFDGFVGNPPFMGGSKITIAFDVPYRNYLVRAMGTGEKGKADLCAYFILRAGELLIDHGNFGLVATNSIAQGDNQQICIRRIAASGFTLIGAFPDLPWPGAAGVTVSVLWAYKGQWKGTHFINNAEVDGITSALTPTTETDKVPFRLAENLGKAFRGTEIKGNGFILRPDEAIALLRLNEDNRDVIFKFLTGEDIGQRPDQSPSRFVINFHEWSIEKASEYTECFKIVTEKVKSYRETITKQIHEPDYWKFWDKRLDSYARIRYLPRVLVRSEIGNMHSMAFAPQGIIYSNKVIVFAFGDYASFAILQSTIHEQWARKFAGAPLRTDMCYSAKRCLEPFPFPPASTGLGEEGERYFEFRKNTMEHASQGLTDIYNSFHDRDEKSEEITELRRLHMEMDQAVAAAYGWNDLDLGHGFHETKQGVRYTISESARRTVLNRLLVLNHKSFEEEARKGLHPKGIKAAKAKTSRGMTCNSTENDLL